jgi:hypothetical protein
MVERTSQAPFSDLIKTAPEATRPYIAELFTGETGEWPFTFIEQPNPTKAIFVAKSGRGHEGSPSRIVVSYEESTGLSAKRTLHYRMPEFGDEYLVEGAEIRLNVGGIDIVYASVLDSPFVWEDVLKDRSNFFPAIRIEGHKPNAHSHIPPLAHVKFDPTGETLLNAQFALADFEEATNGDIENRRNTFDNRPSYRTNYFALYNTGRSAVGVSRFEDTTTNFADKEYSHSSLHFDGWYQNIGSDARVLDGSDYKARISNFNSGGDIRFFRQNIQSGEEWMLSVPRTIEPVEFDADVSNRLFGDFLQSYPVAFYVKKPGEEPLSISSVG